MKFSIESFFSHLKVKWDQVRKVADESTLSNMIYEYIIFYNQSRFKKDSANFLR